MARKGGAAAVRGVGGRRMGPWWLILGVLGLLLLALLGLLWLVIEFPGLTAHWKEVRQESSEGRASHERWRRDSVMMSRKGRGREMLVVGEQRERRRGSRKVSRKVDQEVQCMLGVPEEVSGKEEEYFRTRKVVDDMVEEVVPTTRYFTDDEDSGVFSHHGDERLGRCRKESIRGRKDSVGCGEARRCRGAGHSGGMLGVCDSVISRCGDSVVIVIHPPHRKAQNTHFEQGDSKLEAEQHKHLERGQTVVDMEQRKHSVMDTLDLATCGHHHLGSAHIRHS